jgi:hypothetical protein
MHDFLLEKSKVLALINLVFFIVFSGLDEVRPASGSRRF